MPDFDPCGMIVDLIRSCYTVNMSFFKNRPDIITRVQWYFANDTASELPFPTRFGSGNWASQKYRWPGPGEVLPRQRRWYSGAANPNYLGLEPCGTDDQFLNGTTYPPAPFPRYPDGVPTCCMPLPPCTTLWDLVDVTGGLFVFTTTGFQDNSSYPSPCDSLTVFNNTWDDTTVFTFYGGFCEFDYILLSNSFWQIHIDVHDVPNITVDFLYANGTGVVARFTGSIPIPYPLPVSYPVTVILTYTGFGACGPIPEIPATLTVNLFLRSERDYFPSFDFSLGLHASVHAS
jgi:hypothetical protein